VSKEDGSRRLNIAVIYEENKKIEILQVNFIDHFEWEEKSENYIITPERKEVTFNLNRNSNFDIIDVNKLVMNLVLEVQKKLPIWQFIILDAIEFEFFKDKFNHFNNAIANLNSDTQSKEINEINNQREDLIEKLRTQFLLNRVINKELQKTLINDNADTNFIDILKTNIDNNLINISKYYCYPTCIQEDTKSLPGNITIETITDTNTNIDNKIQQYTDTYNDLNSIIVYIGDANFFNSENVKGKFFGENSGCKIPSKGNIIVRYKFDLGDENEQKSDSMRKSIEEALNKDDFIKNCLMEGEQNCFSNIAFKKISGESSLKNSNPKLFRTFQINPLYAMKRLINPNHESDMFRASTKKEDYAQMLFYEKTRIDPNTKERRKQAYKYVKKLNLPWANDLEEE
jgi:hypothetical protein